MVHAARMIRTRLYGFRLRDPERDGSPDDERRDGVDGRVDPADQADGARIPEPRTVPGYDLLASHAEGISTRVRSQPMRVPAAPIWFGEHRAAGTPFHRTDPEMQPSARSLHTSRSPARMGSKRPRAQFPHSDDRQFDSDDSLLRHSRLEDRSCSFRPRTHPPASHCTR